MMTRLFGTHGLARLAITMAAHLAVIALSVPDASAHEARPAYLEIVEIEPARYKLIWRTPLLSGSRLAVLLQLPPDTEVIDGRRQRIFRDSVVERLTVEVPGGLAGKRISFPGLESTITDVLARVEELNGGESTHVIRPSRPWLEVEPARGPLAVATTYLEHGIEHILSGYDHLLFVVVIYLVARSRRALLTAITAFTIGHSITLAASVLGVIRLPAPPIEASIALSIVLLASEAVRQQRTTRRVASHAAGSLAFCFGLIHGLGFASALSSLGLPDGSVPLALFAFNVGVEIGQIAFIAGLAILTMAARQIAIAAPVRAIGRPLTAYAAGAAGSFWFFERLAGFTT